MRIEAWRVHDSGLAPAPGPFRRLAGGVRHHRVQGDAWPDRVTLELTNDALAVEGVGSWPVAEVTVQVVGQGPPATFVVQVPGAAHLLAAPADATTAALLEALTNQRL